MSFFSTTWKSPITSLGQWQLLFRSMTLEVFPNSECVLNLRIICENPSDYSTCFLLVLTEEPEPPSSRACNGSIMAKRQSPILLVCHELSFIIQFQSILSTIAYQLSLMYQTLSLISGNTGRHTGEKNRVSAQTEKVKTSMGPGWAVGRGDLSSMSLLHMVWGVHEIPSRALVQLGLFCENDHAWNRRHSLTKETTNHLKGKPRKFGVWVLLASLGKKQKHSPTVRERNRAYERGKGFDKSRRQSWGHGVGIFTTLLVGSWWWNTLMTALPCTISIWKRELKIASP